MYAKMLIGKSVTVAESSDKSLVGLNGKIVDETKNTLLILKSPSHTVRVPKSVVTIQLDRSKFDKAEILLGRDIIGTPQERIYKY
jgi:ribonuclease P protein subunit POP4